MHFSINSKWRKYWIFLFFWHKFVAFQSLTAFLLASNFTFIDLKYYILVLLQKLNKRTMRNFSIFMYICPTLIYFFITPLLLTWMPLSEDNIIWNTHSDLRIFTFYLRVFASPGWLQLHTFIGSFFHFFTFQSFFFLQDFLQPRRFFLYFWWNSREIGNFWHLLGKILFPTLFIPREMFLILLA